MYLDQKVFGRSVVAPTMSPFDPEFERAIESLVYERRARGPAPSMTITGRLPSCFSGVLVAKRAGEPDLRYTGMIFGDRVVITSAAPKRA